MPNAERRVRLTADQIERVHKFALAENRSFDGAARRLINLGLMHAQQSDQPSATRRYEPQAARHAA